MTKSVPRQILPNIFAVASNNVQAAYKMISTALVTSVMGLSLVLTAILNLIIGLISSLQLVIIQMCFDLVYPGNVQSFFSLIIPIATFDVVPSEYSTKVMYNFDP